MDKVLITGAEGFFASRFAEFYKSRYNIIPLSHNDLDITDEKRTIETIKKYNPNFILHAAALSDRAVCENNPSLSYEINVKGSINVAKGCYITGKKMIFLSTDQVYINNNEVPPYDEGGIMSPDSVYARHKLEAEKTLLQVIENVHILRLTWLFSFPERNTKMKSNIVWNIVKAVIKNETIKLPVNEYRGMTYVYDLINNFDEIIHLPRGIYNAGSENNYCTYEIGEIILKEMGLGNKIGEILIKDNLSSKKSDIRIYNNKLQEHGISFDKTEKSVAKCINDFSFRI